MDSTTRDYLTPESGRMFASRSHCDQLLLTSVVFAAISVFIIAIPVEEETLRNRMLMRLMIEYPWFRIGFGAVILVFCGWVTVTALPLRLRRTPLLSYGDRQISIPGPWGRRDLDLCDIVAVAEVTRGKSTALELRTARKAFRVGIRPEDRTWDEVRLVLVRAIEWAHHPHAVPGAYCRSARV